MSELELKFQVPEETLPSLLLELGRHGVRSGRMLARYFDTNDGLLARHGLSLRLRKEGRRWVQTLKASGDSAVHRLEHNVPLRVQSGLQPALDPGLHDTTEAGARLADLLSRADAPVLAERFTVEVWRRLSDVQVSGAVIEASLDRGTIKAGGLSAPICELELEYKSGDPQALFALAKTWSGHGGLWLNTLSKSQRGSALAHGQAHAPPLNVGAPQLNRQLSGEGLFRAVLRSALDQVLAHASEVASGNVGEEPIHQLRVGLRRLRTALRDLAPLSRGVDDAWATPLSAAFTRLGEVRDNETVARAVRPLLEKAGAPKLEWAASAVRPDPVATVRDAWFQATLLDLLGFLHRDEVGASPMPQAQALKLIRQRLSKLHKQVALGGERFEQLPLQEQHRVRKRLKRLRYLVGFFQPLWPGRGARRYLARLGPAQDAIGRHNDIAVALENFRRDAEQDPKALFAVGYLQACLGNTARASRAALMRVTDRSRFWKR